jgi:ketosteroid isomerase-like protein
VGNSAERTESAEETDRSAILGLLDRWRQAKDINAILELVSDDVVFLPSSVPPIKGKEEVEKLYRAFFPQYREIKDEAIIEEVQIAGEWAFL